MTDWTSVASAIGAIASAVAAVFAFKAAAKSADVAERAEKRIAEVERAHAVHALLTDVDRLKVLATDHARLANSAEGKIGAMAQEAGAIGGSRHKLYVEEINQQRANVSEILSKVDNLCPKPSEIDLMKSTSELISSRRIVQGGQEMIIGHMNRLRDVRDGQP